MKDITIEELDAALTDACADRDAIAADLSAAQAEVERLRAQVAELEATLANERGEGEPPEVGWVWDSSSRRWELVIGVRGIGFVSRGNRNQWAWGVYVRDQELYEYASTARAAIRAAAKAVRGES